MRKLILIVVNSLLKIVSMFKPPENDCKFQPSISPQRHCVSCVFIFFATSPLVPVTEWLLGQLPTFAGERERLLRNKKEDSEDLCSFSVSLKYRT